MRIAGRGQLAMHRFSFELHFGALPKGMCVLHRCDNRACVRPDHLFLGTRSDNAIDCHSKGRMAVQAHKEKYQGSAHGMAKLTEEQVRQIRTNYATGAYTQKALAHTYGVASSLISFIVTRRNWTHIS